MREEVLEILTEFRGSPSMPWLTLPLQSADVSASKSMQRENGYLDQPRHSRVARHGHHPENLA
jgi:hypothetical protein